MIFSDYSRYEILSIKYLELVYQNTAQSIQSNTAQKWMHAIHCWSEQSKFSLYRKRTDANVDICVKDPTQMLNLNDIFLMFTVIILIC